MAPRAATARRTWASARAVIAEAATISSDGAARLRASSGSCGRRCRASRRRPRWRGRLAASSPPWARRSPRSAAADQASHSPSTSPARQAWRRAASAALKAAATCRATSSLLGASPAPCRGAAEP
eukprot:3466508-Lingulodinium_polyedra.AAC.1